VILGDGVLDGVLDGVPVPVGVTVPVPVGVGDDVGVTVPVLVPVHVGVRVPDGVRDGVDEAVGVGVGVGDGGTTALMLTARRVPLPPLATDAATYTLHEPPGVQAAAVRLPLLARGTDSDVTFPATVLKSAARSSGWGE